MASNKFIFHQQNYCQDKSTLLIFADSKSLHLQATLKHCYSLGIIGVLVTYLMSPSTKHSVKYGILQIHLGSKCAMFGLTLPKLFAKLIWLHSHGTGWNLKRMRNFTWHLHSQWTIKNLWSGSDKPGWILPFFSVLPSAKVQNFSQIWLLIIKFPVLL